MVDAIEDSFAFDPLIGVVGVMADKDYEGVLGAFEPVLAHDRLHPELDRPRACPPRSWPRWRRGIFGIDRVYVAPRLDDAIEQAATLAEEGGVFGEAIGSGAVLVTGSVVTVGEARRAAASRSGASRDPLRRETALCAAILSLQAIVLFLHRRC